MERLSFSARARRGARRRRRLQRAIVGLWITCVLGAVAGIPFAERGVSLGGGLLAQLGDATPVGGFETTESAASTMRFRAGVFGARPAPTPTPEDGGGTNETAYVPPAGSVAEIIYAAAAEFGLSGSYLLSVASCESGLNPGAVNPAGYHGLFQFDQSTWAAYGYGSIYDPAAQARTAARLIAAGQASRWPSCT